MFQIGKATYCCKMTIKRHCDEIKSNLSTWNESSSVVSCTGFETGVEPMRPRPSSQVEVSPAVVSVVAESEKANDPDKAVDFLADDELDLEKEKKK